jgi:flagellar hook protein FlgE
MISAIQSALAGMQTNLHRVDRTAADLANLNSTGYRAEGVRGQAGALLSTGNPLDLALTGDGWFRVASFNGSSFGETLYTRAGDFHLDGSGSLVTAGGRYVVGYALDASGKPTATEAPLRMPSGTVSVSVGEDGVVTAVDAQGSATRVGALAIARFANPDGLEAAGGGLYRATGASGAEQAGGFGGIEAGVLETSNVHLAGSLVDTFVAKSAFTASARTFDAAAELLDELARLGQRG